MILLVIRHGESEADILDVHEGRADFELTQKGHRQAAAMAKYVARNYQVTRIYASTLKRAAQTAEHLSDETGIEIAFDPDLMEFNNGLLAGLSHEEADRLYPHIAFPLIRRCTVRNPRLNSAAEPKTHCRECFRKTVQSPS